MKVAVLMGGKSFEREVSLASGKVVCEALEEAGHKVVPLDTNADLVPTLCSERPDVVYNALHGKHGEDGTIQGLFQLSGIPYVGCDTESSAICMDKAVTHSWARRRASAIALGTRTPCTRRWRSTAT